MKKINLLVLAMSVWIGGQAFAGKDALAPSVTEIFDHFRENRSFSFYQLKKLPESAHEDPLYKFMYAAKKQDIPTLRQLLKLDPELQNIYEEAPQPFRAFSVAVLLNHLNLVCVGEAYNLMNHEVETLRFARDLLNQALQEELVIQALSIPPFDSSHDKDRPFSILLSPLDHWPAAIVSPQLPLGMGLNEARLNINWRLFRQTKDTRYQNDALANLQGQLKCFDKAYWFGSENNPVAFDEEMVAFGRRLLARMPDSKVFRALYNGPHPGANLRDRAQRVAFHALGQSRGALEDSQKFDHLMNAAYGFLLAEDEAHVNLVHLEMRRVYERRRIPSQGARRGQFSKFYDLFHRLKYEAQFYAPLHPRL